MTERRNGEWQTAVKIDSSSTLTKTSLLSKHFYESMIKTTLSCPKISGRSGKELPIKRVWE